MYLKNRRVTLLDWCTGLIALFALGILLLAPEVAHARLLCDGHPIPEGKVCCAGGRYCEPGFICIADNKCMDKKSPRYCGNGNYCKAGTVCKGNGCVDPNAEKQREILMRQWKEESRILLEKQAVTKLEHETRTDNERSREVEERQKRLQQEREEEEAEMRARQARRENRHTTSCSTITDKDHPSGGGHCGHATRTFAAAKDLRKSSPRQAAAQYRQAAESFRLAGDAAQAAIALKEAEDIESVVLHKPEMDPSRFTINIGDKMTCEAIIRPQINLINETITGLIAKEPLFTGGAQVRVGTCATHIAKLLKAGMIYGPADGVGVRAAAEMAENHEQRACLALKAHFLSKACKCAAKGESFSTDPVLQEQMIKTYESVQSLERNGRQLLIRHPAIREMIKKAQNVHDCFNLNTLHILSNTEKALEEVVGK